MAQRETTQQKQSFGAVARRVSLVSIAVNVALTAFKVLAGIVAHSGAMISDAIHSASDIFSTVLVMIGVSVSERRPDAHHPYGHERMECVASILLAVIDQLTSIISNQVVVQVLNWLSFNSRYTPFTTGTFHIASIVFFLSVAAVFLFLTARKLESRRWS